MDGFPTAPWWVSDTEEICCILARHLTVRGLIIESVLPVFVAQLGHLRRAVGVLSGGLFFHPTRVQISRPGQKIASPREYPDFYY